MYEYLPWSKKALHNSCLKYEKGDFPILDIELGGLCNLNCIYCDSPDRTKKFVAFEEIKHILQTSKFDWLFICGLGEPTFSENKNYLLNVLDLCKQHQIKCSMFTNLTNFDDKLFEYVKEEVLYVMFKLDSFNPAKLKKLYGKSNLDVEKLLENIDRITSLIKIHDGCTNVCASIVPTSQNYDDMPEIIDFCTKNKIFPLIGDLEDSGKGRDVYDNLKLSDEQLFNIKCLFNEEYSIPICPSVLCGIHVLYDGSIAVDESTGLSCHWFWLAEPKIKILKNISEYSLYKDIVTDILEYRNSKIQSIRDVVDELEPLVFGGCGGDIKKLLYKYISLHDSSFVIR